MSRWRPPQEKSSPYITVCGYQKLSDELNFLWKVKRPEVTKAVSEAAAQGDRSENAEYIYGKKQLREIDRRVRFLALRLDELKVIEEIPSETDRVYFGASVTLELDVLEGKPSQEINIRIVGADEIDSNKNHISIDSPMARAILKKQVDDLVVVSLPDGSSQDYIVKNIVYE